MFCTEYACVRSPKLGLKLHVSLRRNTESQQLHKTQHTVAILSIKLNSALSSHMTMLMGTVILWMCTSISEHQSLVPHAFQSQVNKKYEKNIGIANNGDKIGTQMIHISYSQNVVMGMLMYHTCLRPILPVNLVLAALNITILWSLCTQVGGVVIFVLRKVRRTSICTWEHVLSCDSCPVPEAISSSLCLYIWVDMQYWFNYKCTTRRWSNLTQWVSECQSLVGHSSLNKKGHDVSN